MNKVKSISVWYVLRGIIFGIGCGYIWIWSRLGEGIIIGMAMMILLLLSHLITNLYYEKREYENKN